MDINFVNIATISAIGALIGAVLITYYYTKTPKRNVAILLGALGAFAVLSAIILPIITQVIC